MTQTIVNCYVDTWAHMPAYEVQTEDGPMIVNPPDRPMVVAEDRRGNRYIHTHDFGDNWKLAGKVAERARDRGTISLNLWGTHPYPVYGSQQYLEDESIVSMHLMGGGHPDELPEALQSLC